MEETSVKVINTENAPAAIGPYSQAIVTGNTLYISGQLPLDPATMEFVGSNAKEQTQQCLENLQAIVLEAGFTLENVVKCGIFLQDMNDFAMVNEAYSKFFSHHKPARFCVEVSRLPKDAKVEIDAIAVK